AGLDLADLSRTSIGVAAAPAILLRTMSVVDRKKATSFTLSDAVDAMSADELEKLELEEALDSAPEICPVLTAVGKASEIGTGSAWHASYKKATQLEPTLAFSPINLATQVYRERLLLSALS